MTNWIAGFADLLMPDPAARTAIDETIEDYRDERAQASSIGARWWSDVQCIVALGRVLTLTALRDLAASDTWRVVGSCVLLSVAIVPLFLLLTWPDVVRLPFPSGIVYLILMPAALVFGPIAALGWFDRADRPVRILAPLVVSALLMLVVMGWLIPAASQSLRVAMWASAANSRPFGSWIIFPGPNELDLPSLIRRSRVDWFNLAFTQALVIRVALILAAPTGLLLGAAVRQRWRHRVNWRVLQASGLLAAIAIIVVVWLGREAWSLSYVRGQGLNLPVVGGVWLPIVVAWMATIALVRRREAKIVLETS